MDSGEKVCCCFVIASGNSPVLLKLAEEILDQVSGLIEFSVIGALCFSVAFGWDHSAFAISLELVNDPFMRIEDFVGNQGICRFESTEPQRLADHELAPELKVKPVGVAQRINRGMNLRTRSHPCCARLL